MGPMGYFDYVSDDTNTYQVKLDASNALAVSAAAATSNTAYPPGWEMRYLLAQFIDSGSGRLERRKVPCPDPTSGLWTGATNQVALEDVNSAAAKTFDITGRVGEKRYARAFKPIIGGG